MPAINVSDTTYLVTLRNATNKFAAFTYPSRKAACAALATFLDSGVDGAAWVVQNEDDIAFGGKLLLEIFNGLTDSGVKKFESQAIGARRLLSVLPQVAKEPQKPAQEKKTVSDATTTTEETTSTKGRRAVDQTHSGRSDWKKLRGDTMRAKVAEAMFDDFHTVPEIAALAGIPEDRVLPHIYATFKDSGLGYTVENERYKLEAPEGVTEFAELLAEKKQKPAKQDADGE